VPSMQIRMTVPVAKLLAALLAEPAGEHYGLQLMQQTGIASGTLYPILARLQTAGWLTARWEDEDPSDAGRPVRRYYQLTAEGAEKAQAALVELRTQTSIATGGASVRPAIQANVAPQARPAW
jgi:PadR family transcriptional regulator, regulatory protein PadR